MLRRREFLTLSAVQFAALCRFPGTVVAEVQGSSDDVVWLSPDDRAYASHATPFNRRIKTQPALIAVCLTEQGVVQAVRYANEHDLPVAVKAGGHCFEGYSLNDDGLVIDVSLLKDQQADDQHYYAGAGVTLSEAYDFLLPRGRIVPMGSCGSVGLAGLTLGGGYGMFSRRFGLACDNLICVRMADGRGQVRDSRTESDLLWACRGGGNGNFGVVTGMWYTHHPAPTHLPRERIRFRNLDADTAASLCERWFSQSALLPEDAFSAFVLNGSTLTILITWFDPASRDTVKSVTAAIAQGAESVADPANEPIARAVARYYGASEPLHFKNVSAGYYRDYDDLREGIREVFAAIIAGPGLIFQINTLGGAIADPLKEPFAAYPHRAYAYLGELQCYWDHDSQTPARIAQVHTIQDLLRSMGIDRHYRNYPSAELKDWATAYYSESKLAQLRSCKQRYDPENRFRHPQSIR